jgi:hypothetical protein
MSTASESKHTPGAIRAAMICDEQLVSAGLPGDYLSRRTRIEALAEIIDRETAAPAMLEALEQADRLLTQCLSVLMNKKVEDHIPWGVKEDVHNFVVNCVGTDAIRLAKGEL